MTHERSDRAAVFVVVTRNALIVLPEVAALERPRLSTHIELYINKAEFN